MAELCWLRYSLSHGILELLRLFVFYHIRKKEGCAHKIVVESEDVRRFEWNLVISLVSLGDCYEHMICCTVFKLRMLEFGRCSFRVLMEGLRESHGKSHLKYKNLNKEDFLLYYIQRRD